MPKENEMKGIQYYDKDYGKWKWCPGYIGLSDEEAKQKIKMLRRWAREDESSIKYRTNTGEIVPV